MAISHPPQPWSRGLCVLKLYDNPLFEGNVALYRRHGCRVEREAPFKGGITVHMRKDLT